VGSLGCPQALEMRQDYWRWNWSLLRGVEAVGIYRAAVIVWAVSATGLLLGLFTRASAVIAWCLALSIRYVNPEIHNAGDIIRNIILFYLMLCPCGAAWSVDAWLRRRASRVPPGPLHIHPWPVRLLFVQLVVIYFFNGLYKVASPHWREGDVLYYVLANPMWGRWSYAELPTPYFVTRIATWTTMLWELCFPLLVLRPRSRAMALWLGVVFHVGILVSMELGAFPLYMMCMYLAEAPWERFADGRRDRNL
ncbi:MAG: HTTM domain-containing protein, partial [Acidobacteria bacterium]|nr:HTTM domain-containing protein [Acidobacteriota bacterium]